MALNLLRRNTLAREIIVVLAIKLTLLFGLWYTFFRQPVARDLTDASVSRVIVGDRVGPSSAPVGVGVTK